MLNTTEEFLREEYGNLRSIIQSKFKIESVTTYILSSNEENTYMCFEGSNHVSGCSDLHTDISSPKVVYNKKGLFSSINRRNKAIFYIPLNINGLSTKAIMVLESPHYKRIVGKEKLIYKEIFDFKNKLSESLINGGCPDECTIGCKQ